MNILIQVLEITSQLRRLSLNGAVITDTLINALVPSELAASDEIPDDEITTSNIQGSSKKTLCPSLEWLELPYEDDLLDLLSLVINSRGLKVSLSFDSPPSPLINPWSS